MHAEEHLGKRANDPSTAKYYTYKGGVLILERTSERFFEATVHSNLSPGKTVFVGGDITDLGTTLVRLTHEVFACCEIIGVEFTTYGDKPFLPSEHYKPDGMFMMAHLVGPQTIAVKGRRGGFALIKGRDEIATLGKALLAVCATCGIRFDHWFKDE